MNALRQRRAWFWVAIAAIMIALVVLLVPHGHGINPDQPAWLALLPVSFVGLIAPLSILPLRSLLVVCHAPVAPALAPSFQRPPPLRLA
jgi:bacteriorhodopsin